MRGLRMVAGSLVARVAAYDTASLMNSAGSAAAAAVTMAKGAVPQAGSAISLAQGYLEALPGVADRVCSIFAIATSRPVG